VPCSASRVVPGAHRVVGPDTHRGSGPREVHTTARAVVDARGGDGRGRGPTCGDNGGGHGPR
jgi:hypothetical protein